GQIRGENLFRGSEGLPSHFQRRLHHEISLRDVDVVINVLSLVSFLLLIENLLGTGLLIFLLCPIFPIAAVGVFGNLGVKLCLRRRSRYCQCWVEFYERRFKLAL